MGRKIEIDVYVTAEVENGGKGVKILKGGKNEGEVLRGEFFMMGEFQYGLGTPQK